MIFEKIKLPTKSFCIHDAHNAPGFSSSAIQVNACLLWERCSKAVWGSVLEDLGDASSMSGANKVHGYKSRKAQ
jgi:hypothetical protein